MKHENFNIGLVFMTSTGQRWRCTDVGERTILAIELKPELDEAWFVGPPYAMPEVSFDERDIAMAYRDETEAIEEAIVAADSSAHPGYPNEIVSEMTKARFSEASRAYPRQRLFRIDRVGKNGEILHPFAAEPNGSEWQISVYLPFANSFCSMPDIDFVRLRPATEADLGFRANSHWLSAGR